MDEDSGDMCASKRPINPFLSMLYRVSDQGSYHGMSPGEGRNTTSSFSRPKPPFFCNQRKPAKDASPRELNDMLKKKTQTIADLNKIITTLEEKQVEEVNQLKDAMKMMKNESIEKQQYLEEYYERSIQEHSAALENISLQLSKSNRREQKLADTLLVQNRLFVEMEEKLEHALEDNTLLKVSLQKKLAQSDLVELPKSDLHKLLESDVLVDDTHPIACFHTCKAAGDPGSLEPCEKECTAKSNVTEPNQISLQTNCELNRHNQTKIVNNPTQKDPDRIRSIHVVIDKFSNMIKCILGDLPTRQHQTSWKTSRQPQMQIMHSDVIQCIEAMGNFTSHYLRYSNATWTTVHRTAIELDAEAEQPNRKTISKMWNKLMTDVLMVMDSSQEMNARGKWDIYVIFVEYKVLSWRKRRSGADYKNLILKVIRSLHILSIQLEDLEALIMRAARLQMGVYSSLYSTKKHQELHSEERGLTQWLVSHLRGNRAFLRDQQGLNLTRVAIEHTVDISKYLGDLEIRVKSYKDNIMTVHVSI
ncbi:hypothetical protein VP01_1293g2 [Puccinia sorghi]|uniref:Uncharacterized protein n=1 Tax=Puccinia sorghi TaxID=27349 RepID=A0A0L6VNB2_9BASI|nr:hypothetical protein VP01_1293g2 [Puccinia sorghi]